MYNNKEVEIMKIKEYDEILENDIFLYLDDLRESGITNMFGASPYIEAEFDMDKRIAYKYLSRWMETFSDRHEED